MEKIVVPAEAWDAFMELLDRPARDAEDMPKLVELLSRKAPWEE